MPQASAEATVRPWPVTLAPSPSRFVAFIVVGGIVWRAFVVVVLLSSNNRRPNAVVFLFCLGVRAHKFFLFLFSRPPFLSFSSIYPSRTKTELPSRSPSVASLSFPMGNDAFKTSFEAALEAAHEYRTLDSVRAVVSLLSQQSRNGGNTSHVHVSGKPDLVKLWPRFEATHAEIPWALDVPKRTNNFGGFKILSVVVATLGNIRTPKCQPCVVARSPSFASCFVMDDPDLTFNTCANCLWNADTAACVDSGHARPPPRRSARAGARVLVGLPEDEKDAGGALEAFIRSAETAAGELESLSFVASAGLRARVVLANSAARRVAGLTDGTYNSPPPVATPSSSLAPLSGRKRPSADIAGPVGPKKKIKTSLAKGSSPVSLSSSASSSSSPPSSSSSEDEKKKKRRRKEKKRARKAARGSARKAAKDQVGLQADFEAFMAFRKGRR